MKNFNIIDKQGIKLNTANKYVNDDINVGLSEADKTNLVAENIKKDVNILGVVGTHEGGGSLNVAYSLTPPTDTSKIWLQCAEPSGVDVQNYLGECAVSNVSNYELPLGQSTVTFGVGQFKTGQGVKHTYKLEIFFKDNENNQNVGGQEAEFDAKIIMKEAGTWPDRRLVEW